MSVYVYVCICVCVYVCMTCAGVCVCACMYCILIVCTSSIYDIHGNSTIMSVGELVLCVHRST